MSVILILIIAGIAVAGGFLAAFIWAVRSGQYDDTTTPPLRILFEEAPPDAKSEEDPPNSDSNSDSHRARS